MKKVPSNKVDKAPAEEDLLPEYDFDYSKAKPNRFAKRVAESGHGPTKDGKVRQQAGSTRKR